jgi:hypothetical protein
MNDKRALALLTTAIDVAGVSNATIVLEVVVRQVQVRRRLLSTVKTSCEYIEARRIQAVNIVK